MRLIIAAKRFIIGTIGFGLPILAVQADEQLIEAEAFEDRGGWVVDQQSMDQMGSPYLMAHGLGAPVKDAQTRVRIVNGGKHRIWVRTRDWVGKWKSDEFQHPMKAVGSPGIFHLLIDNRPCEALFGEHGAEWHWQDGGSVELAAGEHQLVLKDLSGFNGRCDAIFLSDNPSLQPGNSLLETQALRDRLHPRLKVVRDAFQSTARHLKISPYPIPYRCLYSRNVPNLMMAGRNISVTHVALGTIRVMRTTGMMGEVLGMANAIMKKNHCLPRDVYEHHLDELKTLMAEGVPGAPRLK